VRSIIPSASLDERIVVARNAGNGGPSDEEIRYRSMPRVRWSHKSGPGHEMLNKDRLQGVEACKVLGKCLQIVPKTDVAVRFRFEAVFVVAPLSDGTSRGQATGGRHRQPGAADHKKATSIHRG